MKLFSSSLDRVIFRRDEIVQLCRGKKVLHLGFIQHAHLYQKKIEDGDWLHSQIAEVARTIVGIDYLESEVEEIKKDYHFEAYSADVTHLENLRLKDTYDVIVCGELIEHLENPGLMLEGVKRFMNSESIIIITTPNPWSTERMRFIKAGIFEDKWLNPEHAMWFSPQTLKQILQRTGYAPVLSDYYYGQSRSLFYKKTEIGILGFMRLIKRLIWLELTPNSQFDGLFFVAKLASYLE